VLISKTLQQPYLIEQSISLCQVEEDKWLLGHALDSLARLAWEQGDAEQHGSSQSRVMQLARKAEKHEPRSVLASVLAAGRTCSGR